MKKFLVKHVFFFIFFKSSHHNVCVYKSARRNLGYNYIQYAHKNTVQITVFVNSCFAEHATKSTENDQDTGSKNEVIDLTNGEEDQISEESCDDDFLPDL